MPEERRGGQRPARSPLAPQVGRLDVELDAQFNLIERLLISRGSTCTLKRPENKQIHDPQTGDWSAEWKAYFARLRFCIGELNIAPASFVIAPEAAQIVMVGQAPGVAIDKLIAAPSGAIEIAGAAPFLSVDQLISAPAGAMQIAGSAPVALVDQLILAPAGAMQIAGLAPVAEITVEVDAPSGAMEVAGQVPTVEATSPLTSISLFDSATSTAETITAPDDIIEGDLIVLVDRAKGATEVVPTDFDDVSSLVLSGTRQVLSWKRADGTEGGTSITGMNGSTSNRKALYIFRGNVPATTITPTTANEQITNGNPTAQTVLAAGGTAPRVVIAAYGDDDGSNDINPRTFTVSGSPAKDGEINPDTHLYLAYMIQNGTLQDVVADMDDEVSINALQSIAFDMSNA